MKKAFFATTLAASMFLNAQQSTATTAYQSDIATALTAEKEYTLTPGQQRLYERVDNDPTLQEIFKTIRIENGYVYFDTLWFAISLEKKLAKSATADVMISTNHLTEIENLIWLENMIDLLNLSSRYIVANENGEKEFVCFSKVNGQYTGEIEKRDGELIAVHQEYEQPVVEKRIYPLKKDVVITPNNPFYVLEIDVF